jgi:hypothetical protein
LIREVNTAKKVGGNNNTKVRNANFAALLKLRLEGVGPNCTWTQGVKIEPDILMIIRQERSNIRIFSIVRMGRTNEISAI